MISLERFILGVAFFLILICGIILLFMKDNFVRSPKMHYYLGASTILFSCALLDSYIGIVCPNITVNSEIETVLALVGLVVYANLIYNIVTLFIKKITLKETGEVNKGKNIEKVDEVEKTKNIENKLNPEGEKPDGVENADESKNVEEEQNEEDEENVTDENGEPIPEPSENNMEDLIFFQKLEALMVSKKLFCDQDITREQIAAEIGTNRTYLIRSIKFATGKTFNEYITSLRINYAATLLITTDEPLDYIGTIAGFRSKSAYYRAFTAANNCTPTEYRNRNKL